jgi:hypothetical protein
MAASRVKIRPLSPAEQKVLELARAAIKPMCDLFRMVPQEDWSPATLSTDGAMRKRFLDAEAALDRLYGTLPFEKELRSTFDSRGLSDRVAPSVSDLRAREPERKPLFEPEERMHLGERGYSKDDIERIRTLTVRFVEGRVLKGEVNPENDEELKAAVKQAGRDAMQAFNAALEYLSG